MKVFSGTGLGAMLLALGVACAAAGMGSGAPQFNGETNRQANGQLGQLPSRTPDEEPYVAREMQARQLKRLREEHQKQVFNDTTRLVQLATALKAQVDKGDKPVLDVLKEVDEIGKLAKRVSDRIKTQ